MGSLAIEGHGVRQGGHDEAEILRMVRRSFSTSDRRMHTRQMQVWLALCQAGQHVQGLHTAGHIYIAGLLKTIDLQNTFSLLYAGPIYARRVI
jgi:hypothetical protein